MSDRTYCDSHQCQWVYGCKKSRHNCPNDPNEPWTWCVDNWQDNENTTPKCYEPI